MGLERAKLKRLEDVAKVAAKAKGQFKFVKSLRWLACPQ